MNEHSRREPAWRRYARILGLNHTADLDDELRDHLESTVDALVADGWTRDAARTEALRRFGDLSRVRDTVERIDRRHHSGRDRLATLEAFWYDLRHAARALRRSPGFTLVATISIALGVAANTTVFSIVNAMLLRPIPGATSTSLVRVYQNHHSPFDWREIAWFRERTKSFSYLVGERTTATSMRATTTAEPERIRVGYVTRGFFPALGVRMTLGSAFDVDEIAGTTEPRVVITYAFWQRRFAGDSGVIGKTISLAGHPVTIGGVAARDFRSSVVGWTPDLFAPFAIAPLITGTPLNDFGGSFYMTAKLAPGASAQDADNELRVLTSQLARTDSARYERTTFRVDHIRGVNAELRPAITIGSAFLMVLVGMVLLIACANVANLLLGRGATRRTEIGVRLALGASRTRLVRQLLTESLLLSALGSAVGFAAAWSLVRIIPLLVPPEAGLDDTFFAPDHRVLLFTGALCVLTTLLFGMAPALRTAASNVTSVIKGDDVRPARRRGALVGVQTALCIVLLAVASLLLRSFSSMQRVDHGFKPDGLVDATIDLNMLPAGTNAAAGFSEILKRAAELPGVTTASLVAVVPLTGSNMETRVRPQDMTVTSRFDAPSTYFNVVSPGYFANLGIPMVAGRDFTNEDASGSPRVAVISETSARRLWPKASPIGQRFHWGAADGPLVTVIGVARDADYSMPGESPKPVVYMPLTQEERTEMTLQLRSTANVATIRRAVWDMLRTVTPTLPPPPVVAMTDEMTIATLPVRIGATLVGAFGGLALLLAAAGIYGVASYSVARRTREIGIRAAIGATRPQLIRMVLGESLRRIAIGAIVGVLLTVAASVGLSRVLYGVHAVEPTTIVAVPVVLGMVAVLATIVPARRAARANPVAAIKSE